MLDMKNGDLLPIIYLSTHAFRAMPEHWGFPGDIFEGFSGCERSFSRVAYTVLLLRSPPARGIELQGCPSNISHKRISPTLDTLKVAENP